MQIYDALKKDHIEVKSLLRQLTQIDANASSEERSDLIESIRDALVPHSRAEETVFYNSLRELPDTRALVAHSYQEHIAAETLLRTLQVAGKIDAGWMQTARKLKEALEHHIAEEENKIFPMAQRAFTNQEAEMMANAFEKLKPEIKDEGIMATTSELIANMMPPRFAKAFQKFNLESRI